MMPTGTQMSRQSIRCPTYAELLRPPIDIQRRQHEAQTDNNAIPVNILAEQIDSDTVDVKVQAERRK